VKNLTNLIEIAKDEKHLEHWKEMKDKVLPEKEREAFDRQYDEFIMELD